MSNKCRIPKKPIIVIKIFLSVCFRTMYVWCASLFCCCCSVAQSCPTLIEPMVSLSFTISQSLLKLMSIESEMLSNHLILCGPFLLPSIFPSIRVFSNELALCIRWPKDWSFSISPSNEYSGLMSFRIDWFDLLAVQGTLQSLLQHHSSKASIRQRSAFFSSWNFWNSCSTDLQIHT